jgi:hypothetical protein
MLGLLEGRLERPLRTPFAAEGRFEHGALCVDVPDFPGDSVLSTGLLPPRRPRIDASGRLCACGSAQLPYVLRLLLAVARRLEAPEDVPGRLCDNLKREPLAGVRLPDDACPRAPDDARTREALLTAREDPTEVRLRAATLPGPEARDVVLAVATGEASRTRRRRERLPPRPLPHGRRGARHPAQRAAGAAGRHCARVPAGAGIARRRRRGRHSGQGARGRGGAPPLAAAGTRHSGGGGARRHR